MIYLSSIWLQAPLCHAGYWISNNGWLTVNLPGWSHTSTAPVNKLFLSTVMLSFSPIWYKYICFCNCISLIYSQVATRWQQYEHTIDIIPDDDSRWDTACTEYQILTWCLIPQWKHYPQSLYGKSRLCSTTGYRRSVQNKNHRGIAQ